MLFPAPPFGFDTAIIGIPVPFGSFQLHNNVATNYIITTNSKCCNIIQFNYILYGYRLLIGEPFPDEGSVRTFLIVLGGFASIGIQRRFVPRRKSLQVFLKDGG